MTRGAIARGAAAILAAGLLGCKPAGEEQTPPEAAPVVNAAKPGETAGARPVDRPDSRTKRAGTSQDAKPVPPIRFYPASRICINTMVSDALRAQVPYHHSGIDGLDFQISRVLSRQMQARGVPLDVPGTRDDRIRMVTADPNPDLDAIRDYFWREDCPNNGVHIIVRQLVDVNAQGLPYRIRLDVRQGAARWTTEIERRDRSEWPPIPAVPAYVPSLRIAIATDSYTLGEGLADYLFRKEKTK